MEPRGVLTTYLAPGPGHIYSVNSA